MIVCWTNKQHVLETVTNNFKKKQAALVVKQQGRRKDQIKEQMKDKTNRIQQISKVSKTEKKRVVLDIYVLGLSKT